MNNQDVPISMLAGVWRGKNILNAERCNTPSKVHDADLIVKVRSAVFGAALVRAVTVGHPKLSPPATLGSLIAGDTIASGVAKGDSLATTRVIVDPHPPCLACVNCLDHDEALCTTLNRLDPGGLAEYVRVPASLANHVRSIPDHVSYDHAAYTEIVACVLHAIELAAVRPADKVVIVGAGPVGLLLLQLALARGAIPVYCLHNNERRVSVIRHYGGVPVNSADDGGRQQIMRDVGGRGADVVFEAVGSAQTYELALKVVRPSGAVIAFGGCPPGTTVPLDINALHYNAVRLVGAYHYPPGLFERALALISAQIVNLESIATHSLSLSDIAKAPTVAKSRDCVGLCIHP